MATKNPRITITLTPAVAAVLRELSESAGNSQSAIVGELLEMSRPVFERVVASIRAAHTMQATAKADIAEGLKRAQERAEHQLGLTLTDFEEATAPLLEHAEAIRRRGASGKPRAPGDPRAPSTPRPVTRGVGPRKEGQAGRGKGGGKVPPHGWTVEEEAAFQRDQATVLARERAAAKKGQRGRRGRV